MVFPQRCKIREIKLYFEFMIHEKSVACLHEAREAWWEGCLLMRRAMCTVVLCMWRCRLQAVRGLCCTIVLAVLKIIGYCHFVHGWCSWLLLSRVFGSVYSLAHVIVKQCDTITQVVE